MELAEPFLLDLVISACFDHVLPHSYLNEGLVSSRQLKPFNQLQTKCVCLEGNHWGWLIRKFEFDVRFSS